MVTPDTLLANKGATGPTLQEQQAQAYATPVPQPVPTPTPVTPTPTPAGPAPVPTMTPDAILAAHIDAAITKAAATPETGAELLSRLESQHVKLASALAGPSTPVKDPLWMYKMVNKARVWATDALAQQTADRTRIDTMVADTGLPPDVLQNPEDKQRGEALGNLTWRLRTGWNTDLTPEFVTDVKNLQSQIPPPDTRRIIADPEYFKTPDGSSVAALPKDPASLLYSGSKMAWDRLSDPEKAAFAQAISDKFNRGLGEGPDYFGQVTREQIFSSLGSENPARLVNTAASTDPTNKWSDVYALFPYMMGAGVPLDTTLEQFYKGKVFQGGNLTTPTTYPDILFQQFQAPMGTPVPPAEQVAAMFKAEEATIPQKKEWWQYTPTDIISKLMGNEVYQAKPLPGYSPGMDLFTAAGEIFKTGADIAKTQIAFSFGGQTYTQSATDPTRLVPSSTDWQNVFRRVVAGNPIQNIKDWESQWKTIRASEPSYSDIFSGNPAGSGRLSLRWWC